LWRSTPTEHPIVKEAEPVIQPEPLKPEAR
jgi:hypothetical protein